MRENTLSRRIYAMVNLSVSDGYEYMKCVAKLDKSPLTDPRDAVTHAHCVVVDGQYDKLVTDTVTSLLH